MRRSEEASASLAWSAERPSEADAPTDARAGPSGCVTGSEGPTRQSGSLDGRGTTLVPSPAPPPAPAPGVTSSHDTRAQARIEVSREREHRRKWRCRACKRLLAIIDWDAGALAEIEIQCKCGTFNTFRTARTENGR